MSFMAIVLHVLGLGLLMMFSAFFSGSETALSALTKAQIHRLRGSPRKNHQAIVHFIDEPRRLFITVLFGNTLVNIAFVSITGSLIYRNVFRGTHTGLASIIAILTQTLLLLILGEITPKIYAIKHSEGFSYRIARPLWFFSILIYPIRKILRSITDAFLPMFGVTTMVENHPLSTEELKEIIKETEEHGALDEEEGEILHNIFEIHDIKAKEVMVPRIKMVCTEVDATIQEVFEKTRQAGFSRLPVYRKNIDNICGIFYVKDLPRWKDLTVAWLGDKKLESLTLDEFMTHRARLEEMNPGHANTLVRHPYFVLNTKKIGPLIREMTIEKQQMAILLDEYGGVSGLITVEDIVEEVLGEIRDEYDIVSDRTIVRDPKDPSSVLVPGFVSLRSANRRLQLRLDESLADTVGGYVIRLLGSLPKQGDVVLDESNHVEFHILMMAGTRIDCVRLKRIKKRKEKKPGFFKSALLLLPLLASPLFAINIASRNSGEDISFSVLIFLVMLVLSIFFSAFFSGSETAVVSASKARIEVLAQTGDRNASIIKSFKQAPDKMLGVILVGNNLMLTAAGVAGLNLTSHFLPGREGLQEFLNIVVMTALLLIFGEIIPKTAFRAKADSFALRSALGLKLSALLLNPFVFLATKITNLVFKFTGEEESQEKLRIMREELKLLAKMGEKEGAIKAEQLQMLQSVLDLENKTIEDVMTPLIDIVALPADLRTEDFFKKAAELGFSRFPVYEERIDNIIGMVNILDVLYAEKPAPDISSFVSRDITLEPKSKRVSSLLKELKPVRNQMVFVVDEYGGIIGLITIEDLVEEIMGDIRDEKDIDDEDHILQIGKKALECDGKTEIQKLNYQYDMPIPQGDYRTIAGYVISLMQKIPKQGESIETDTFKIIVMDADARSVRRVRISKKS